MKDMISIALCSVEKKKKRPHTQNRSVQIGNGKVCRGIACIHRVGAFQSEKGRFVREFPALQIHRY